MSHAIIMHQTGGPEVLRWEAYDPGPPQEGEALVRHEAVGLNFIDVYHRTGLYPVGDLPAIPGMEGAGRVEAVGPGVSEVVVGDRVAYAGLPPGAYAERRRIPAHRLVKLPEGIPSVKAAAMMLQGMTARYLLKGCAAIGPDSVILLHAAAGGVGLIACQWAKALGARIIGTVGTPEKADLARAHGCDHTILYGQENFVDRVRALTDGRGVDVVYDSVGQATFLPSLDCLRPMGTMVSFGQASGAVAPIDPGLLAAKGSLFLTRPSLMTYTAARRDLLAHAQDLFDVILGGAVKVEVRQTYPLARAADAHRELEARQTKGSSVFVVDPE